MYISPSLLRHPVFLFPLWDSTGTLTGHYSLNVAGCFISLVSRCNTHTPSLKSRVNAHVREQAWNNSVHLNSPLYGIISLKKEDKIQRNGEKFRGVTLHTEQKQYIHQKTLWYSKLAPNTFIADSQNHVIEESQDKPGKIFQQVKIGTLPERENKS